MTSPRSPRSSPLLNEWGELRFLEWVRRHVSTPDADIPLGMGDDAAHLKLEASRDLLVTTDGLIENVHFNHSWTSPRDLGFKAAVSNLSDLAAMAARPVAAFLSLGVPPDTPIASLKDFFFGVRDAGRRWSCPLAGGDLVRAPIWSIHLTLLGSPAVKRRVVTREGARPGHTVFVTGQPGESAAGLEALKEGRAERHLILRHRRPTPRLPEAEVLAKTCGSLALIDVSDGIATETRHLAKESGVRLKIDTHLLPASKALARYAAKRKKDFRDWALYGGEDYELLFTTDVPLERLRQAFAGRGLRTQVTAIGSVVKGRGVRLLQDDGSTYPARNRGFQHFG